MLSPVASRSLSALPLVFALLAGRDAAPARAAVFTAGPGGTYGTLGEAVGAALAAPPGVHEIRAGQGQYDENLVITVPAATVLKISGGWNAAFSARVADPELTILDGGFLDSVVWAEVGAGSTLELNAVLLRNGRASVNGGGLRLFLKGGAARLLKCVFVDNSVVSGGTSEGGGIAATILSGGNLILKNSTLRGNLVHAADARGGGLSLSGVAPTGSPAARFTVAKTRFENNRVESTVSSLARGAAIEARGSQATHGKIVDSTVGDHDVMGAQGGDVVQLSAFEGAVFDFRRNAMLGGGGASDPERVTLIDALSSGGSRVTVSDSLVARGTGPGVVANAFEDGTLRLTNLTVADNERDGIRAQQSDTGILSVANSITHGNAPNLVTTGTVAVVAHLGSNPRFRDRADNDYRLGPGSLAANSGFNAPPGGLGDTDLARTPRVKSKKVDRGAYESF